MKLLTLYPKVSAYFIPEVIFHTFKTSSLFLYLTAYLFSFVHSFTTSFFVFYLLTLQSYFLGHGLALRRKIFNKEIETLHLCFLTSFLVDSVFAWIISVILICLDSIAYELVRKSRNHSNQEFIIFVKKK